LENPVEVFSMVGGQMIRHAYFFPMFGKIVGGRLAGFHALENE
jgi:hypothetical protein